MKLTRGTIALYVGLVFVCGGVLGFFANRLYTVSVNTNPTAPKGGISPEEYRARVVAEYKRRMNLSDDQVLQLNLIFDDSRAKVQAEHKAQRDRSAPEFQKIYHEQVDRINAMLNPDQRAEYGKIREEQRQRGQKNKENKEKTTNGGGHNGPGF